MAIEKIDVKDDDIELTITSEEESEEGSEESVGSPESSLEEKGEDLEDKGETEGEEAEEEEAEDVEGEIEEEPGTYKDKTREEVIEMHKEAEIKIGLQGEELGKKRELERESEKEEIKEKISLDDMQTAMKKLRFQRDQLDPELDKDEYNQTLVAIGQAEQDILEKRQTMMIQDSINSRENSEFIIEQKEELKKNGFFVDKDNNFIGGDFDSVIEQSKLYTENGRLTKNSIFKAMIDLHGIEKVSTFMNVNAEKETRNKIKKAADKIDTKIDSRGKGSETPSKRIVGYFKMSPVERSKFLDGLSIEEMDSLQVAVEKRAKKK